MTIRRATSSRRIGWHRAAFVAVCWFVIISVRYPEVVVQAASGDDRFAIQADWMRQVLHAAQLSWASYDDIPSYVESNGFQVFGEFPNMVATTEDADENTTSAVAVDNTLVVKKNGECYVAWRGTNRELWAEWEQNFDWTAKTLSNSNCQVHSGFDDNYSQRDLVDAAIADCLASCGSSLCPLILTGHSQGGATAAIASLYWNDENPIVITFGAPRAVYGNCNSLQADQHYRFVTVATASGDRMQYDLVPMIRPGGATIRHYGHAFLINEQSHLAYLGYNDDTTRSAALPSIAVHSIDVYLEQMEQLYSELDDSSYPVYNSGWSSDEACDSDDECASGRCTGTRFEGGVFGGLSCQALLESCDTCQQDSDCASGQCVYYLSALRSVCAADSTGRMDDGCVCDWSSDCLSGRCEGVLPPYVCEGKREVGEGCNEDSDCQSGKCGGVVWNMECQ